jgi:hypothetical protein
VVGVDNVVTDLELALGGLELDLVVDRGILYCYLCDVRLLK